MARIGFGLDSYVFHSGKYHILLPTLPPAYQTLITVVLPGPRGPFSRVQITKLCLDVVPVGGSHHGPIER
jgi:hypothetical protein